MSKFFVDKTQIENNRIEIVGQDVNHIKNVLRKVIGDKIELCQKDNCQNFLCEIITIDNEKIVCKIVQNIHNILESNINITIFQGLPKQEKMELIIQKSVELGGYSIVPVKMARSIVKINEKDAEKKIQRWQKISEVAAKQSGRNSIPKIDNITTIKVIYENSSKYDMILVPYEKEKSNNLRNEIKTLKGLGLPKYNIAIVIGPEGGFEEDEIELLHKSQNSKILTLGNRILRTETVALNMISILMYELESLNL